jgi:hypothetical protein
MSDILVVGLDHFLQSQPELCLTVAGLEAERQQKQQFETLVRQLIRDNGVELVAEEGTFDAACLGCRLAQELGLQYVNITMPQADRDRLGITNDYEDDEDTKAAAVNAFEQYMIERVKAHGAAEVILVLCGRLHIDALRSAFENSGHAVKTYDVADYDWFQGKPIEGDGGVVGYVRQI